MTAKNSVRKNKTFHKTALHFMTIFVDKNCVKYQNKGKSNCHQFPFWIDACIHYLWKQSTFFVSADFLLSVKKIPFILYKRACSWDKLPWVKCTMIKKLQLKFKTCKMV